MIRSLVWLMLACVCCGCVTVKQEPLPIKCHVPKVPVLGFAQAFVGDSAMSNAKITIIETGETKLTDRYGRFASHFKCHA